MAQMVADVLVGVLEQIGVRQVFGLIGDSLNPLGDAVRRSTIESIGVRHEPVARMGRSAIWERPPRIPLTLHAGYVTCGSRHRNRDRLPW